MKHFQPALLSFCLYLFIVSCSHDPLDKPISEPLSIDVLKELIEKDPSFAPRHEFYESLRKVVFDSDTKVAVYDATYNDGERWFEDIVRLSSDLDGIKEKATNEWQVVYDKDKASLDSLVQIKKDILREQGIGSYVDFKFKNLEPSKISMDRDVNFTITPKRGCKIQNYTIHYVINKAGLGSYSRAQNGAIYKASFSREDQDWDVQHTNGDWVFSQDLYYKTQGMSSAEMTKLYNVYFYVTGIVVTTKDGKRLSESNIASSLGIPRSLELYIKEPSDIWELMAIQECIDKSYTSKENYINSICDNYLRGRNRKFYQLLDAANVKIDDY